jgi:cytochrome c-type biogenesis protein CcmH
MSYPMAWQTDVSEPKFSNKVMLMIRAFLLFWTSLAFAGTGDRTADKAREIEDILIAPCCWTRPVSQHYSEAAEEIRRGVREMVAAGKTREEILDYYVSIYGERILATPRASGFNILVYIMPWLAFILGTWLLIMILKKLRAPRAIKDPAESALPDAGYSTVIEEELRDLE